MSHTEQTQDRLIGMEIGGKYKIVKLLGEGGMGAVYLGEQKLGATIRKVAIKTLHQHLSHDAKILARFEREVGTVAGLQHPNTIQVFDYGKMDDGQLYIVMEFVEGQSVATVLEKTGAMEPARVQKILEQMCGSLEEAHGQGIVHRDLKPDNVVLCERAGQKDWVEVLDFGIAKRSTEEDKQEQKLTQQGMVLGTPPYMSPEQFTGKPIDKRSDIYSLGVMAFEMLTGSLPFSGNTAWEWATAHMTAQPVSMDTLPVGGRVPAPMKMAIQKALEKDPNNRWSSVTEFYKAFAEGVSAHAALAATAPMPPEAPRHKTEVGTPMPGGMYGAAPAAYPSGPQAAYQTPGAAPAYAAPAQYGTPAQGNQSYTPQAPFQGVAPGPPPRQQKSGGNGLIFALIGVGALIAVGSGVGYLVTRKPAGGTGGVTTSTTTTSTATTTTTADTSTSTSTGTTADTTAPLASLKGTTTVPPVGTGTGPKPTSTGTGTVKPPTSATATATTTATTPTVTATTTATTPPPVAGPPECGAAVLMRKLGKPSEAETLRIKCVEKGGKDPFAK